MTTPTPRRRGRPAALAAGALTAFLMVLAIASPASASIGVSPSGLHDDGDPVTVAGTAPNMAATHATVAQCAVIIDSVYTVPGTRCSLQSASTGLVPLGPGRTYSFTNVVLDQAWSPSFDFTSGAPTPVAQPVDCAFFNGASDLCGVMVSYYSAPNYPAGPITQLGYEYAAVLYNP